MILEFEKFRADVEDLRNRLKDVGEGLHIDHMNEELQELRERIARRRDASSGPCLNAVSQTLANNSWSMAIPSHTSTIPAEFNFNPNPRPHP